MTHKSLPPANPVRFRATVVSALLSTAPFHMGGAEVERAPRHEYASVNLLGHHDLAAGDFLFM